MIDNYAYTLMLFPFTLQLLFLQQLLPHPTYLSVVIALLSTLVLIRKKPIVNKYTFLIGGTLLSYGSLTLIGGFQTFSLGFIIISFCILLIVAAKNNINIFIKLYIILVFVVSLSGLLSWILVQDNLIDYNSWRFSLYSATEGKIHKGDLFVNPYGLGLVFHKVWTLFGITYHRASGFSHEPHIASLFSNPALIYLFLSRNNNKIFINNTYRTIAIVIMTAFMIVTNSIAAQISLILIIVFYLIVHKKTILLMLLLAFPIYLLLTVEGIPTIDRVTNTSIILSKFSVESESLRNVFDLSILSVTNFIIMMILHVSLYLYNRNAASIVCMYILFHMLKGGGAGTILITPLYVLFLLISINSVRFKWMFPSKGAAI
jgi:hypothetical protein